MDNEIAQDCKLQVYFDGMCFVCSKKKAYFQRGDNGRSMDWIDIASPEFDAEKHGFNPVLVNRQLHVRTPNGEVKTGVMALAEIWKRVPKYQFLASIVLNPLIYPFAFVGYRIFARFRGFLP